MELGRYLQILRNHRALVLASVALGVIGAAALAWLGPQTYAATSQLFVSVRGTPGSESVAYSNELFAEQRARAFARIIAGDAGARTAIEDLGLTESAGDVAEEIGASVAVNSAVIEVAVGSASSERALAIAEALDRRMPRRLERLEKAPGRPAPVRVTVSGPAEAEDGPASPRKAAYLAMGALIGLAIGIVGALLRHALHRRIRTAAEATLTTGAPVLGRIAEQRGTGAAAIMLRAPLSPAADGYRDLRFRLSALRQEHELRSLLIASPLRGDGKTEVVAGLGLASVEAGERVVAVDANLRSPDLGRRLAARPAPGVSDVLMEAAGLDQALQAHPSGLDVLTAGTPVPSPGDLLDSAALKRLLAELSERFDLVLVDSPPLLAAADAATIAPRADAVVLVLRPAVATADAIAATGRSLTAVGRSPLGVVLNRVSLPGATSGDAPQPAGLAGRADGAGARDAGP